MTKFQWLENEGAEIKVIAGRIDGTRGPVRDLAVDVEYLDVKLAASRTFEHSTARDDTVLAYVVEGSGYFDNELIESRAMRLIWQGRHHQNKSKKRHSLLVRIREATK